MEKINGKMMILLISIVMAGVMPACAFAESQLSSLNDLINDSQTYDGSTVRVRGEALLEALERKGYAWVNINDGTNAMGVVLPYEEVNKIKRYGDYKNKGDQIEIEAVFHRSCSEHGGDMDLHFVKMIRVTEGEKTNHEVGTFRLYAGFFAILAAAGSVYGFVKK